ncbi:MAG TPA: flavin reductase family protein [Hyphomicrobiaceae bacterium]|nr:flavin reductase family protein [Hyphomicrobiaceae bacterium]
MPDHYFDFSDLKPIERYKLLCGIVVPRPIALVTSMDRAGRVNAAPFSFFNVFSEDPAQIVLGLQHRSDGSPKDTTRNIAETGTFVVNMVDEAIVELMNACATDFPSEIGEIAALGIETESSRRVPVPRIKGAPFALECRRTVSLAFTNTRELLIGEVVAVHGRAGHVDPATFYIDDSVYRPVGRLAGSAYCRQGETFKLPRMTYEEWRKRR